MQRMSGVATQTAVYVARLEGLHTKVLDTRKTTPGMRVLDKMAVKIGGGYGNSSPHGVRFAARPGMVCHLETSGYPRFCEGARYWLQWAGFDEKVYSPKENRDDYKDDYMSRAHWVNALTGGSERMPDSARAAHSGRYGAGVPLRCGRAAQ